MDQWVKNPLAEQEMQEAQIRYLCGEDPLKEGTATPSSILAWRIPWTEEPGGRKESDTMKQLSTHAAGGYSFQRGLK